MTQNKNKQFNTYKEGLDLEFLREYCMEHGERRTFERGETLEEAGEPAQWVAFVERGCFKYMVHNDPKMAKMDVKILKRSNLFACYQRDARTCSRWSMGATSTTTATPPAAATAVCSNAVRRWCRCSH